MKAKIFIGLLCFVVGFNLSCKREVLTESGEKNSLISKSKVWFEEYYSGLTSIDEEFSNVNYRWDLAKLKKYENGYSYVIVPMLNKKTVTNYLGVQNLMICPTRDGKFFTRVIYSIPETEYFRNKKGHPSAKDFTGYISFWDLQKGFIRGAQTKNGEITGGIEMSKKSVSSNIAPTANTTTLPWVTVVGSTGNNIWVAFTNAILNAVSQQMLNIGPVLNPCEYGSCAPDIYSAYEDYIFDLIAQTDIIVDMIDNPCLRQVLDKINSINNTFLKDITDKFNSTDVINVSLYNYEDTNLNSNSGQAKGTLGGNYFEIGINTFQSTGASEEEIAGTFIHEMIHAYLMAFPITWDATNPQHTAIISDLSDEFANDLHTIFPNLPLKAAYAIAFEGLVNDSSPAQQIAQRILIDIKIQQLNLTVLQNSPVTQNQLTVLAKTYQKGGTNGSKTGNCQ